MDTKFFAVSVAVFYGLSVLMLLVFTAPIRLPDELIIVFQGLGVSGTLAAMVSLAALLPLYFWYRQVSGLGRLRSFQLESKGQALFLPLILFVLAMSVRASFVVNLGSPLEKIPLIFLIVLTIVLAENYSASSFGFTFQNFGRHLALGVFLFMVRLPLPYLSVLAVLSIVFDVDLVRIFEPIPFLAMLSFQTLAVGLSEEALFRGYMQTKLSSVMSQWRAIIVQAALFGFWHVVWYVAPLRLESVVLSVALSFLFGLLNGVFFRYSRSLIPLVLSHGLWNSFLSGIVLESSAFPGLSSLSVILLLVVTIPMVALLAVFAEKICKVFGVSSIKGSEVGL
ncbi:MAG: CPBP family intramembrane metalloprotease [Thaumarchaeota archaeon]|nr:CPBP family intramembrane metalloprotease [Nitrososphaerota archaeon]